jgi:hypothetical protein
VDISEPVVDLPRLTTATSMATFSNQKPAITMNQHERGYGIAYAFFLAINMR